MASASAETAQILGATTAAVAERPSGRNLLENFGRHVTTPVSLAAHAPTSEAARNSLGRMPRCRLKAALKPKASA